MEKVMETIKVLAEFYRLKHSGMWDTVSRLVNIPTEIFDDYEKTKDWFDSYISVNAEELADGLSVHRIGLYYYKEE